MTNEEGSVMGGHGPGHTWASDSWFQVIGILRVVKVEMWVISSFILFLCSLIMTLTKRASGLTTAGGGS